MTRRSRKFAALPFAAGALLSVAFPQGTPERPRPEESRPKEARDDVEFPCDGYLHALHGKGNFGVLISDKSSPFADSFHLAEDVWAPAGTEVRSVAAGIVRYSDFSPSWIDADHHVHWNLGNVIVIEHPLDAPPDSSVCSFYVHLAADRRVAVGDAVKRGQPIGRIGKDLSEENGLYPAHLHFGLHKGPYFQIAPSFRRQLETEARTTGILCGAEPAIRGEIVLLPQSETSVLVKAKEGRASVVLSLLTGSTAPGRKPADIMSWCTGYGDRAAVDEWLCPSQWIAARSPAKPR